VSREGEKLPISAVATGGPKFKKSATAKHQDEISNNPNLQENVPLRLPFRPGAEVRYRPLLAVRAAPANGLDRDRKWSFVKPSNFGRCCP
jgi:hypothetical protein